MTIRGICKLTSKAWMLALLALVSTVSKDLYAQPANARFAQDAVLVKFAPGIQAEVRGKARAEAQAELEKAFTIVPGLEKLKLRRGQTVGSAINRLRQNPNVLYAEPDFEVQALRVPNDPRYGELWGMKNARAEGAWDIYTGSSGVTVAVIDTGVDYNHEDLRSNIWKNPGEIPGNGIDDDGNGYVDDVYGWDFAYNDSDPMDLQGHGTHVAGTIGGIGNNATGVAGVNWNVRIMALKFLNDSGSGSTSNAIKAVQYATRMGVRISNNSWGGGSYSQALKDAIEASKSVGHLFVAAAGNSSRNADISPMYPAGYDNTNIVSVASITSSDAKSSFSNYGARTVDIGAPGSGILSTLPNNSYSSYNGTSMASPHVAGAAALVLGLNETWSFEQVRDAILKSARPTSSMNGITVTGGVLDIASAVRGSAPKPPAPPSGLQALAISMSQIDLIWQDNSTNETGFHVEQAIGQDCSAATYQRVASLDAGAVSYSATGLTAGTAYCFRVQAYSVAGASPYSNPAAATTKKPVSPPPDKVPPTPSNFSAAFDNGAVRLNWADVQNESGYEILRQKFNDRKGNWSGGLLSVVDANTTAFSDVPSKGGKYRYAVRAFSSAGASNWTSFAEVTVADKPKKGKGPRK